MPKKTKPSIMETIQRIEDRTEQDFDHNWRRLQYSLPYSGRVTIRIMLEGDLLSSTRRFTPRVIYNTTLGEGFSPKDARDIADDSVLAARIVSEVEEVVADLSWNKEEHDAYIEEATALLQQRQLERGEVYVEPGSTRAMGSVVGYVADYTNGPPPKVKV